MNLPVAIGMQQYPIIQSIGTTQGPPNSVMAVPPRFFGDFLTANRADTGLPIPQIKQLPFPLQVCLHRLSNTLFEVGFPCRIIRIGLPLDFDMATDRYACRFFQLIKADGAILADTVPLKYPMIILPDAKILPSDPTFGSMGMSS